MEKFLFFRNSSANTSIAYPKQSFRGCYPRSDTTLEVYMTPIAQQGFAPGRDNDVWLLTITANKHKDVMEAISEALNVTEDLVIVIFDDVDSEAVSTYISNVSVTVSSDP